MKRIFSALILLALTLTACTRTKWKDFSRWTMFQKTDIKEVTIRPDGSVVMKGYENDGGNAAVNSAISAAAEGMARGLKPTP